MGVEVDDRRLTLFVCTWLLLSFCTALVGAAPAGAIAVGTVSIPFQPVKASQEVTIWHIPHADDETLGMAGAITDEIALGRRNLVVFYTDGGASDVRHVINGVFYCALHGRNHDPVAEGYKPLSVDDFSRARLAEATAALMVLGVSEDDIWSAGFRDGVLQVEDAYLVMQALDRLFPDAAHRTTSLKDRHSDHRTLARALFRLIDDKKRKDIEVDAKFFSVYQFQVPPVRRGAGMLKQPVTHRDKKEEALAQFALWQPDEGRFAVGMHSVPNLFHEAATDPHEYLDPVPPSISRLHLRNHEMALHVFYESTTLSARFSPSISLRVGTSFAGEVHAPAITFHSPTWSGNLNVYAGLAVAAKGRAPLTPKFAGIEISDRLLLEYRLPAFAHDGRGLLRIGWKWNI